MLGASEVCPPTQPRATGCLTHLDSFAGTYNSTLEFSCSGLRSQTSRIIAWIAASCIFDAVFLHTSLSSACVKSHRMCLQTLPLLMMVLPLLVHGPSTHIMLTARQWRCMAHHYSLQGPPQRHMYWLLRGGQEFCPCHSQLALANAFPQTKHWRPLPPVLGASHQWALSRRLALGSAVGPSSLQASSMRQRLCSWRSIPRCSRPGTHFMLPMLHGGPSQVPWCGGATGPCLRQQHRFPRWPCEHMEGDECGDKNL
mmetsp:Transcript_117213/g.373354  ORF Transcript_117213/g.373354 Transcript_117213/m.373354 type:complete len:255 (+) Transcript_117213:1113-1877(+)